MPYFIILSFQIFISFILFSNAFWWLSVIKYENDVKHLVKVVSTDSEEDGEFKDW